MSPEQKAELIAELITAEIECAAMLTEQERLANLIRERHGQDTLDAVNAVIARKRLETN